MKNILALLLATIVLLSACVETAKPPIYEDETTEITTGTSGISTIATTSGTSGTSPSTATQTTTETETTTTTTAQQLEVKINTDLLSDLGATYEQIVERRGKIVPNEYVGVQFENGYGSYFWCTLHSKNTDGNVYKIESVRVEDLFLNIDINTPIVFDKVAEKIPGLEFRYYNVFESNKSGGATYYYGDIRILIGTQDGFLRTDQSSVFVHLD